MNLDISLYPPFSCSGMWMRAYGDTTSPQEATLLRVLSSVSGGEVSCTPLATINQCRGELFCRDNLQNSEEKLLKEMSSEGVCVHRFKKVDGVLTPTPFFSPRATFFTVVQWEWNGKVPAVDDVRDLMSFSSCRLPYILFPSDPAQGHHGELPFLFPPLKVYLLVF